MLVLGDEAFGQTFALVVTFGSIGLLVGALVAYILAQVYAERRQNAERREQL
jgi:hypothetical protein